jgi:DNA polymerase-3 subunit alpha
LKERMAHLYPNPAEREAQMPRYVERLEFELVTILKMGFPGYFLIVGDFINWAKNNGCPVGPGRGSGAGSLVAYVHEDHRPGPFALQPAVRAFSEPRAGLHARL